MTKPIEEMSLQELKDAEQEALNAVPEEVMYTRTVAGKTFTAESPEALLDLVSQATEELVKAQTPAPAAPKERTADDEFVRSQSLASQPTATVKEIIAEEMGVPIGDLKSRMDALRAYEANLAAESFVNATPEFFPTPVNGTRIQESMRAANLECTVDNIRKTYEDLKSKGLMVERPAEFDPWGASLEELRAKALGRDVTEIEW